MGLWGRERGEGALQRAHVVVWRLIGLEISRPHRSSCTAFWLSGAAVRASVGWRA
jgi:hypothetical protein